MRANPKHETTMPNVAPLRRLIARTRRLLRASWAATGLGLALGLACGFLAATSLLDIATALSEALRALCLVLIIAPAAWAMIVGVIAPLVRRLPSASVARRIEAKVPDMHERLVSAIELDADESLRRQSPVFFRRLAAETLERVKGFRPSAIVDVLKLQRAWMFCISTAVAFAAAFLIFDARMQTAMARVLQPFEDIPPYTGVLFDVEPGDGQALKGEDVIITAKLVKGEADDLRVQIETAEGDLRHDLERRSDGVRQVKLTGLNESFFYRVHGGGTWSKRFRMTLIERPRIADFRAIVHDPPYLGLDRARSYPIDAPEIVGLRGGETEVQIAAEGQVAEGEIQWLEPKTHVVAVPESERGERIWFQEFLPPGAHGSGSWQWDFRLLARPAHCDPPHPGHHWHRLDHDPKGISVKTGDIVFAYIYLFPDNPPESIMLAWHDGANWEHRALWGAEKIHGGQKETPSRRLMGPRPAVGEWVRLEAPASALALENKTLRGVSFELFGGHAHWHRVGVIPASTREEVRLETTSTFPLAPVSEDGGLWGGKFPMTKDGLFRVELRNSLGAPSPAMKEIQVVALDDKPPSLAMIRPGPVLDLAKPRRVPIVIDARDDVALAAVSIAVQRPGEESFTGHTIRAYDVIKAKDQVIHALDLTAMTFPPNSVSVVKYRLEARDRKGQSVQSPEYQIRLHSSLNGADRRQEQLDQRLDRAIENIRNQAQAESKIAEALKRTERKHEALLDQMADQRKAQASAQQQQDAAARPAPPPPLPRNPEQEQELAEVRQELAQIVQNQNEAVRQAQLLESELNVIAEEARKSELLPPQAEAAVQDAQRMVKPDVVQPEQALAQELARGADPKQPPADPGALQNQAEAVKNNLEAMANRLENVREAQNQIEAGGDPEQALDEMRGANLRDDAQAAQNQLGDAVDQIQELDQELGEIAGQEQEIVNAAPATPERMLEPLENEQERVEAMAEDALEDVRELHEGEMAEGEQPEPEADGDQNRDQGQGEVKAEAQAQAQAEKKAQGRMGADAKAKAQADQPAEAGAQKGEPGAGDPNGARPDPNANAKANARRSAVKERGEETLEDIRQGRDQLKRDREQLERIRESLRQATQDQPNAPDDAEIAEQLNSEQLKHSLELAERLRQLRNRRNADASKAQPDPNQPNPSQPIGANRPNLTPNRPPTATALQEALAELDPKAKAVILKMPAKQRDELLQGMRERSPEGYQKLVQDYFRRLTEAQGPK